jgi:plastocyanin
VWFTVSHQSFCPCAIARLDAASNKAPDVLSVASGFVPHSRSIDQGASVQWSFYGPANSTVTDRSGMGLFDSGTMSFVSYYSFTFNAAGDYPYQDTANPAHDGDIKVPVVVSPTTGNSSTTFMITWASAPPPAGYASDVKIAYCATLPCAPRYQPWQMRTTTTNSSFGSSDPAWHGNGTYYFRALLENTANGARSNYSSAASITVS